MSKTLTRIASAVLLSVCLAALAQERPITVTVHGGEAGKPISPDLFGIFFEDLNWAADGGLYAELIQNRSFEYQATERPTWNSLTSWELATQDGAKGSLAIEAAVPVHPNNPHYLVLDIAQPGDKVRLINPGFDGIPVKAEESYDVSLFARQLYVGERWTRDSHLGKPTPLFVRLESKDGQNLGETMLNAPSREWSRLSGTIVARQTDGAARFALWATNRGGLALDVISLFPQKTFRGRSNGLRSDLAQAVADMRPRFMRFPGGCLAHGNGLGNMYRWKDTIGPIEQRKAQANLWGYHQTVGLGYFEYFQFCEDIGARPLPVVAAAVSCQNSDHTSGVGQRGLDLSVMPEYIQEVLDLIEYANGPVTSRFGAKRAAAGHPSPFNLQYLGVGNEDAQTEVFRERYKMIHDAVKAKHPEIVVIGTVGPHPEGSDYDAGWKFANEQKFEMVDEHGYKPPTWYWDNLERFDAYDRSKSKVYLGEFAAHDARRVNTLRSALAEAAYMTSLERNGDLVRLVSYAPLLAREGRTQWRPDLIYFTGTNILLTANYFVQQLFAQNQGDLFYRSTISDSAAVSPEDRKGLAMSCVKETKTGDLILKLVNGSSNAIPVRVELSRFGAIKPRAIRTVLAGDAQASNSFSNPQTIVPATSEIAAGEAFVAPRYSLSVIRFEAR